ncbi:ABA4-like family protein [Winogradskyella tangerina]|uniref:ABA4-like family protein n=1 Tax=Winogradskyella tangerina TaxID=2023240 RepID=UPI000DBE9043|nr:ABA4-like family protein [Winogradskyella tangerina]
MSVSEVFSIVNVIALPMWVLMIFLPKWKGTRFLIDYKIIPLVLSLFYAFYIGNSMLSGPPMDFGSLESVMHLFTFENAVLAGWVHYLAFDLLVGMWMLDQNKSLNIHPILMAPCLIGTFMLGPIGFILFMIIRSFKLRTA